MVLGRQLQHQTTLKHLGKSVTKRPTQLAIVKRKNFKCMNRPGKGNMQEIAVKASGRQNQQTKYHHSKHSQDSGIEVFFMGMVS